MKKIVILAATALAALFVVSCNKESAPERPTSTRLNVNFTVSDPPAGTRAVKAGWENGDIINFWFDTNQSKEPDMNLIYQDGTWVTSEVRQEIADKLKEDGYLKFFWEGSNDWNSWVEPYSFLSYTYAPPTGKGFPMILKESGTARDNAYHFDKSTNTLSANLVWEYQTNLQVVVEGITPADGYQMSRTDDSGIYTTTLYTIATDNTYGSNGSTPVYGVANGDNATAFYFNVTQPGEKEITFRLIAPDKTETLYKVTKTFDFESGQNAKVFYAARIPKVKFYTGIVDGHPYVDMGEGHKWAITNVGADTPWGVNDYFAWGDPVVHYVTQDPLVWKEEYDDGYNLIHYRFNTGVNFFMGQSKYNLDDGKTVLDPEDDPATVNWSASWRTPVGEEWQWLVDNTTRTWETLNGVFGRMITSNVNGNSIFLRAAGTYTSTSPSTDQTQQECQYWSSECHSSYFTLGIRYCEYVGNTNPDENPVGTILRVFGLAVRPVVNE